MKQLKHESEGTIDFRSQPTTSYRYRLTADYENLQCWVEDRKSKKQWMSEELGMKDFVSMGQAIPKATFMDYVQCFSTCLKAPDMGDSNGCVSDLVEQGLSNRKITFSLTVKVSASTWTPTYSLVLKPVPLERIDMLEAVVRDQAEEIQALQQQLAKTLDEYKRPEPFHEIQALQQQLAKTLDEYKRPEPFHATISIERSKTPELKITSLSSVIVLEPSGVIKVTTAGVYVIHMTYTKGISLQRNKETITPSRSSSESHWTHALAMDTTDKLSVADSHPFGYTENGSIVIYKL